MTPAVRRVLFIMCAVVLAAGAFHAFRGLPPIGSWNRKEANLIVRSTQVDRHAGNAVTSVTFDYRGFDTLGEEFILFGTSMGVSILLRQQRRGLKEEERKAAEKQVVAELQQVSPAIRALAPLYFAPILLFGFYVAAHGHLTPGGGFQAGAILAGAVVLVFLSARKVGTGPFEPVVTLESVEGGSLAGFVGMGIAGLVITGALLANFLPLGTLGQLLSAGTIPVLSVLAGFAVGSGIVLIAAELLEQRVLTKGGR